MHDVGSSLSYGVLYWGYSTTRETAFKAQKRCIRSICGIHQTNSCKPHFINLHIRGIILVKSNISSYVTLKTSRLQNTLCNKTSRIAVYSNSIFCMSIKIYNKLPQKLNSIAIFKRKLKDFLIQKAYYSVKEFLEEK